MDDVLAQSCQVTLSLALAVGLLDKSGENLLVKTCWHTHLFSTMNAIDAQLKPCEAAAAGDTGDAALVSTCSTAEQSALYVLASNTTHGPNSAL